MFLRNVLLLTAAVIAVLSAVFVGYGLAVHSNGAIGWGVGALVLGIVLGSVATRIGGARASG